MPISGQFDHNSPPVNRVTSATEFTLDALALVDMQLRIDIRMTESEGYDDYTDHNYYHLW